MSTADRVNCPYCENGEYQSPCRCRGQSPNYECGICLNDGWIVSKCDFCNATGTCDFKDLSPIQQEDYRIRQQEEKENAKLVLDPDGVWVLPTPETSSANIGDLDMEHLPF